LTGLGKRDKARKWYEEAVVQYTEALRIEPDHVDTRSNLGNALAHLGRLDDAIAQYEAALRIDPNRADVRYNLDFVRSAREKARQ